MIRTDQLIVQYFHGVEQVGYYSIAVSMSDLVYMLPVVVGTLILPRLAAIPNVVEKWQYVKRASVIVSIIMLGVTAPGGRKKIV